MSEQEQIQEETSASHEIENETEGQIVTEQLAETLGVSKTLVGKPIEELGKSLRQLQDDYGKTKRQLKEVEKAKQKEATKPNLKAPDPLNFEEDGDYEKALKDYIINVASEVNAPILKTLQSQQEKVIMDAVQSKLPTGSKASEVKAEWMEEFGVDEDGFNMLLQNPNFVVSTLSSYAKSKQLDEVLSTIDKKTGEIAIDKLRNSLKIQPQDYELNSVDKTKATSGGMVQRILARQEAELKLKQ